MRQFLTSDDGRVVLNDDFAYVEDPSRKLAGLSYQDLLTAHAEIAEIFDNYNLSVMSVVADSEEPINELFVRLNRSKPLSGAEIRNAMAGPAPKVIRALARHELFTSNITFGVKRGQDQNTAAKLLMFEYFEKPAETKKRNLDGFVKEVSSSPSKKRTLELAGRRTVEWLDVLTGIFLPKDALLGSPGVLPVYYWFIRAIPLRSRSRVREFLNDFERMRRANRRMVQEHPNSRNIDSELIEFDTYNRSTNDLQSHEERVRILKARFAKFMAH